jgi:hypothetical protein
MSNLAFFFASLARTLRRVGSMGIGLFVLSMILNPFFSTPTTFAATTHPHFSSRVQIDGSVSAFQIFGGLGGPASGFVLGSDGNLWGEFGPFGSVPPRRFLLDQNVRSFVEPNSASVFVLDGNGNVWNDHITLLSQGPVPPARELVDGFASAIFPLNSSNVLVLRNDNSLWLEQGPFGNSTIRTEVDINVKAVQFVRAVPIFEFVVLGTDGSLWDELGPFNRIPPARTLIDRPVSAFQSVSPTEVIALRSDNNLYDERAPFGGVPQATHIDTTVRAFAISNDFTTARTIFVEGLDGNLWNEIGPFGSVPPRRTFVDGSVLRFGTVINDDTTLAVEGNDSKLWLETL